MITSWMARLFAAGKANANANGNGNLNGNGGANGSSATHGARATPNGNGASLSPLVDPDDVLAFEFGRARRYERALSIVVVAPISWPDEHDDEHNEDRPRDTHLPTILSLITAAGLREVLRETDIMCYEPLEGRFVLGLTESEGEAARSALDRARALFQSRLRIELAVGVAQFPGDGLTLEDLVQAARLRAASSRSVELGPRRPTHTPSMHAGPRVAGAGVPESASPAIGSN